MRGLLAKLQESFFRVEIKKLDERITALKAGQDSGRLGPRVVRARKRFIEKDRRKLARVMRQHGYEVD
jgi:hypothetical protein